VLSVRDTGGLRQKRFKIKQTTLAFIIVTRLVAPGIAFATEYGFTGWNDDSGINAARLAS